MHTPNALKVCEAMPDSIYVPVSVLKNMLADSNERNYLKHSNGHNISIDEIKKLPELLRKPLIIIKDQSDNTSEYISARLKYGNAIVAINEKADKLLVTLGSRNPSVNNYISFSDNVPYLKEVVNREQMKEMGKEALMERNIVLKENESPKVFTAEEKINNLVEELKQKFFEVDYGDKEDYDLFSIGTKQNQQLKEPIEKSKLNRDKREV